MKSVTVGAALLAAAAASLPNAVLAQERPFAPRMSCQAVAGLIARNGAVVVSTGTYAYDRIVRDQGYCTIDQTTEPLFTATADSPQCFAGYRCKDKSNERDSRF